MKIALVKLSSLGDVVHALPVLATLGARLPGARVTWVVERREAALLAGHPALDDVLTVDTRAWRRAPGMQGLRRAMRELIAVSRRLRAAHFDVTLDLQGLFKSAVLCAETRAPLRIGFAPRWCREPLSAAFTNRRVVPPPAARHVVDQYLSLLAPLGVREPVMEFRLPEDPARAARIEEFFAGVGLKPRDALVVLNPGAGRSTKRWPVERFRELARRLGAEATTTLVVWGPGEETAAREIAAGSPGVLLAPPTDLAALIAILRRATVTVAADTGPLHLAAAAGTPCVGLYGATSAERNGPYGAGHRALQAWDGRVASLGVDDVLGAVRELLG